MKNSKFLSFVLTAAFAMGALVACNTTKHECQHVCEICGACYDESCKDQACSNKCQGHTLSAPTIALNNNAVTWTAVEHAKGYDVYINNSLKTTVTTTSYTITETSVGSYEIKVASKGNGAQIVSSGKSNGVIYQVNPTKLGVPVLTISGNVVSWPAIANAGSYAIYINDVKKAEIKATSYTITETKVGTYKIQVVAVAGSDQFEDSVKSQAVSYTVDAKKLDAPVLTLTENLVSWSQVANAASYDVYVNGEKAGNVTTTGYLITETAVGSYEVQVVAVAPNAQFVNSDKSAAVTYVISVTKLAMPVLSLAGNVVTWSSIENAASYDVFINDVKEGNQTAVTYTINKTIVGSYEVKVVAKAGSELFADSEKSAGVTYTVDPTKLAAPSLTLTGKNVTWSAIEHATGYDVFVNDVKATTITETAYEIQIDKYGAYKVQVVAVTTDTQYANSDKSSAVTYNVTYESLPFVLTSSVAGKIKYDTEVGALASAEATDTDADIALKFIPEPGLDGWYRIITQDGLYLEAWTLLNNANYASNYIVGTFYSEADTTQIWKPRLSEDGTFYSIQNYGLAKGEDGKYQVLDGSVAVSDDHVCTWWDVPHINLQFNVTPFLGEVTFADTPTWTMSEEIDFSKPIIMYFSGRNTLLNYNADEKLSISSTYVNSVTDYTEYAFEVEDAGDGYVFIKDFNGEYLKAMPIGNNFYFTGAEKENTDAFKFKFVTRGGHYFTLFNKLIGPYTICKSLGETLEACAEWPVNADIWFRVYNVESTKLPAPEISLQGNVVSWNAVENAISYDVYVDDVMVGNQEGTSYTITETLVGSYKIQVVAKGGSAEHTDSNKSNSVIYTVEPAKLSAPEIAISGKNVTWEAVSNAASYDVYVNDAKVGNQTTLSYDVSVSQFIKYTVQVVAVPNSEQYANSDKSNSVSYTATLANSPVVITSQNNTGRIKYDTEIGALGWADASESDASIAFKFIPETGKENTYRILTQDGLYLQEILFLDNANAQSCYTVGTYYAEAEICQLWTPRLSSDGTFYTMINVGRNDVLNAYAGYDHIASWSDIPSYDLQFTLAPINDEVTFADTPTWTVSEEVDFSDPFIMYFAGRNLLLDYNASEQLEMSATLVNSVTDYTPYAFEVENAGDGYVFIKDFNGEYLKAIEGSLFSHTEKENTDAFKFKFVTRGGHYFTIINKALGAFPLCKSLGNEITVYGEFPAHGDQWFRIYNVNSKKLTAPEISLQGNVVSWTAVENAASYDVYVNGTLAGNQTEVSYTISDTTPGDYKVQVVAKAGSAEHTDSNKSNAVTYVIEDPKLATPVVTLTDKTVSWEGVRNATGYEVYDGATKLADVTTTSYKINGVALGDHSITVKAVSSNPYFIASEPSTAKVYTAKLDETPVILSIQACGDIVYDPQLGCLRQAVATDTEADKAVQFFPIEGQDGYYNIKTSSGLYLWTPSQCQYNQWYRTLARPDIPDTYVEPLAAWKLYDLSNVTAVAPNSYFHLYNKGLYDTVNQLEVGLAGSPSNNLINVWTSTLDVWTSIQVRTADATIAETPAPLVSGADFSKKSIAYFFGSEDTYAYDTTNNYYVAGKDVSTMTAQEKEAASWTFEDAGDGKYYIKTADGCYMKGYIDGTTCYLTKVSAETVKDAYFEFYFMSRGGHFYSMSNVGLETEAQNGLYAWNTALMTFGVRWQQSCAFIIYIDSIA